MGPDNMTVYVYKGSRELLVPPLTYIFNICLANRIYPAIWQITKVVPVPKSIPFTNITNHRPIALAPVPSKIFEAVIHVQLSGQVEKYILNSQHGFRPVRGVNTNIWLVSTKF